MGYPRCPHTCALGTKGPRPSQSSSRGQVATWSHYQALLDPYMPPAPVFSQMNPRLGLRTTTIWAGLLKIWIQELEALRLNMKTSDFQPHGFIPQLSSNASTWQLSFWLFLIIPASIIHNLYLWISLLWFLKLIYLCRNYFPPNCNIMSSYIQEGGFLLFFSQE